MKKLFLVFLLIVVLTESNYSQSVGVFLGYGASAFSDDFSTEIEQANYIPVGANILFAVGNFAAGGEINYAIAPFFLKVVIVMLQLANYITEYW